MKKQLITFGAVMATSLPVISVVACSKDISDEQKVWNSKINLETNYEKKETKKSFKLEIENDAMGLSNAINDLIKQETALVSAETAKITQSMQSLQAATLSNDPKKVKNIFEEFLNIALKYYSKNVTVEESVTFKYQKKEEVVVFNFDSSNLYNELISLDGMTVKDAVGQFSVITSETKNNIQKFTTEIITKIKKSNLIKEWKDQIGDANPIIINGVNPIYWKTFIK